MFKYHSAPVIAIVVASLLMLSAVFAVADTTIRLDSRSQSLTVSGSSGQLTRYLDFGGSDSYRISSTLSGDVSIIDRQASDFEFSAGTRIDAVRFVSDGIEFTMGDASLKLLGFDAETGSRFIFADNSYDFDDLAALFEVRIPSAGGRPVSGTSDCVISSDGGLSCGSVDDGTGQLRVTLEPAAARTAGAQWRRSGASTWLDSGETESDIPTGGQTVTFRSITGWTAPSNTAVSILADQTTTLTRTYEQTTTTIAGRYLPIEDGSVIRDIVTGFEWQRCSMGQTWNAARQSCDGEADWFTWDDAMQQTAPGGFRMPNVTELRSLVYCSTNEPEFGMDADETFCDGDVQVPDFQMPTLIEQAFPNTPWESTFDSSDELLLEGFWSSTTHATPGAAWYVNFMFGFVGPVYADTNLRVRLVRTPQEDLISGRYQPIEGGAIIYDMITDLEWQRCSVGQSWNAAQQTCDGRASRHRWPDAKDLTAAGQFRAPTKSELSSLIYCSDTGQIGQGCSASADYKKPTIVSEAFPNTPSEEFCTSSTDNNTSWEGNLDIDSWVVHFGSGKTKSYGAFATVETFCYARLVRVRSSGGGGGGGGTDEVTEQPDLVITAISAPSTAVIGEETDGFSVTVKNQGNSDAASYRVNFFVSSNTHIELSDRDTGWGCNNDSGLAAGAAKSCEGAVKIPSDLSPGDYYIGAYADIENAVNESDESNNGKAPSNKTELTSAGGGGGGGGTGASCPKQTVYWKNKASCFTEMPAKPHGTQHSEPAIPLKIGFFDYGYGTGTYKCENGEWIKIPELSLCLP